MSNYWSTLTKNLRPYVPGEQPKDQQYVKLNTNENPFPPSDRTQEAIRKSISAGLNLYPDPEATRLKLVISAYYEVGTNNVFVGNGSDEVLALSFLAFFKSGRKIAFPDITYSFYSVYCDLFEIRKLCIPLDDGFRISVGGYVNSEIGGIIFPNPNAPTGIILSVKEIESLAQRMQDVVIIIDEAYIDFGGDSAIPLIEKYPNILVIQTLSKSRSLAGLRVGFAIGNADLIEGLNRVKNSFNSYPLDTLAIDGAVAAFQDDEYFVRCCNEIMQTRDWFAVELIALSYIVLPSKSNFLFAKHPSIGGATLYSYLKSNGILVRHFNDPKTIDFVRISIGTEAGMARCLQVLKSYA